MASKKQIYVNKVVNMNDSIKKIEHYANNPSMYNLTPTQVKGIYTDIKSKISIKQKNIILNDIENGLTTLALVPGLPINAWGQFSKGGNITAVANLFSKAKIVSDDVIQYQVREVFGVLIYANIFRNYAIYGSKIKFDTNITKLGMTIYVRMLMSIIDRSFAVSSNPAQASGIAFNLARFFIEFVLEREMNEGLKTSMCAAVASNQTGVTDINTIKEFANRIDNTIFTKDALNLELLCSSLAQAYPLIKDFDVNNLLRNAITNYGEKSLYMIETASYFYAYTISSVFSSNLIKDYTFEYVSGRDGAKLATLFLEKFK